jgi:hypothetical protein
MKRLAGLGFCVVGLLVACGGGRKPGETDPDYPYPTEDSFCVAVAETECNKEVVEACYGSDESTLLEDTSSCQAAREAQCNPQGLPYRPGAAEECILERKKALDDAVWSKEEIAAVEQACLPVFSKEGGDGSACVSDYDCDSATGLRCVVKFGITQGVCGVPVTVVGGEDCSDPLAVCSADFYCEQQVSACLKRPLEGEECSEAAPCAEGSYCMGLDPGTCVIKTKNGLACAKDELCAGGFCVGASDTAEGICSSTLPLQITSSSCDPYRQ